MKRSTQPSGRLAVRAARAVGRNRGFVKRKFAASSWPYRFFSLPPPRRRALLFLPPEKAAGKRPASGIPSALPKRGFARELPKYFVCGEVPGCNALRGRGNPPRYWEQLWPGRQKLRPRVMLAAQAARNAPYPKLSFPAFCAARWQGGNRLYQNLNGAMPRPGRV